MIEGVVTESKVGLYRNLSFNRKVMLGVRVIYIYTTATSNSHNNITLGLYVLYISLNEPNVVCKYLINQILYYKLLLRLIISPGYTC
jgi:hypothetical protein